jgi:hypothetical protein
LLALGDVLHSGVIDAAGLGNGNLLMTLSVVLLRSSAITSKVASLTIVEADVARGCSSSRWWWWWCADAEVGGEPTTADDDGADAGGGGGEWGSGGTPSGTLEEHY